MSFAVIENTPGCLPESEPVECATRDEAREAARNIGDQLLASGFRWTAGAPSRDYYANGSAERVVEVQEVP